METNVPDRIVITDIVDLLLQPVQAKVQEDIRPARRLHDGWSSERKSARAGLLRTQVRAAEQVLARALARKTDHGYLGRLRKQGRRIDFLGSARQEIKLLEATK